MPAEGGEITIDKAQQIKELKALAYDKIALLEQHQREMNRIQEELVPINARIFELQKVAPEK